MSLALPALRRGDLMHAVVTGGTASWLVLDAGRAAGDDSLAELRGYAVVDEQSRAADPSDLQPARAMRRALADGRMSAADIGYACAWETGAAQQTRALAAMERGLGRFAAAIELEAGPNPIVRCAMAVMDNGGSVHGALALVITPDVGAIALAFGRS